MMAYTTRIAWETLRSVNANTLAGSYVTLGTPLSNPAYKIKLVNNSTVLVTVSINGLTDIDVAPAGSFWLYDETTSSNHEFLPQGTQIFIKGNAGTGLIYLAVQYLVQG